MTRGRSIAFLAPGLGWLALFLLLPLLLLVLNAGGLADGFAQAHFHRLLEPATLALLADSARLAALATLITLLVGGAAAWAIATARRQALLLLLVLLPFFCGLLLRLYAGHLLLQGEGLLATGLKAAGIELAHGPLLAGEGAVLLGLVYSYLPFAILVLFAGLRRLDPAWLEASAELGASPGHTLLRIVLPLLLPGIAAAALFVFVLSFASYLAPAMLGGPALPLLGPVLYEQFEAGDPAFGAGLASLLVLLILLLLLAQAWLACRLRGPRA